MVDLESFSVLFLRASNTARHKGTRRIDGSGEYRASLMQNTTRR